MSEPRGGYVKLRESVSASVYKFRNGSAGHIFIYVMKLLAVPSNALSAGRGCSLMFSHACCFSSRCANNRGRINAFVLPPFSIAPPSWMISFVFAVVGFASGLKSGVKQ